MSIQLQTSEDPVIPSLMDVAIPLGNEEDRNQEPPTVRARKCLVMAKNLLIQDRTAEAIRMLEQSVKLDPDSEQAYEAWLLLGKHRLSNPAWSNRAIEALQTASKLRHKAAEPWVLMGEIYHRKNFKANAKACFKRALELDPSVAVPSDVHLQEEDPSPEERPSGFLNRFKAILGRQDKS
jgi:tetratricopeptide (TPR) repeat protein